jgi:carboxyl-terminal processing protease
LIFNYANEFRAKNNTIPSAKTFELSNQQYNEFISFVEQAKFDYKTKSEEQLAELEKVSKKEKYYANVSADYEKLKAKIVAKKKTNLMTFKSEIQQIIEDLSNNSE